MEDAKREILRKVASGSITAEEAALELETLESPTPPDPAPPVQAATGTVARVRVGSAFGTVTVIGDTSVLEAVAEGPHTARREGDTLVIETDDRTDDNDFVFSGARRFSLGLDFGHRSVTVRMNPRLPLEAEVQAGTLRIQGVEAPIHAEVQAGSTRIDGFTQPLDLDVQAGSVNARGRLTGGVSRIRCQAGKVKVELDRSSSVRITARTGLGRVTLPGTPVHSGVGERSVATQVGEGAATLDISSEMGTVQVEVVK